VVSIPSKKTSLYSYLKNKKFKQYYYVETDISFDGKPIFTIPKVLFYEVKSGKPSLLGKEN